MNQTKKRLSLLLYLLFVCTLFLSLSGCSTEAKKERHWKKGEQYSSENKLQEAILEYKNVIQLDPKDANAHFKLGLTYLKAGLVREGYREISKTVELNPGMIDAQNQLGYLYLLGGDRKKAKERAEIVIAKDANNSLAHLLLSHIHIAERNLDGAIAEAKKAVEGNSKLEAYLQLAKINLLKGDLPQAEEMFKMAVKTNEKALNARVWADRVEGFSTLPFVGNLTSTDTSTGFMVNLLQHSWLRDMELLPWFDAKLQVYEQRTLQQYDSGTTSSSVPCCTRTGVSRSRATS